VFFIAIKHERTDELTWIY